MYKKIVQTSPESFSAVSPMPPSTTNSPQQTFLPPNTPLTSKLRLWLESRSTTSSGTKQQKKANHIVSVLSVTDGLPDFTDEKEAANFAEKAAEYIKFVNADGKPDTFAEVIKYTPIHS